MASLGNLLSEKQFQCSLCLQVFTDPVTTPCGHNFCQACIQSVWDSNEVCQCPTCQKSFTSRPEISVNAAFKELADMFRKMAVSLSAPPISVAKPGEVGCDVCAGTSVQLKALKSCLVCLTSYCETHLEPHQRVATLKIHKLIDPVENLQARMCKKHERLLEMFCRDEHAQMKLNEAEFKQMIQERLQKVKEIKQTLELSRMSSEKETEESGRLFMSLVRCIEERQAEVNAEIEEKQKASERRAELLLNELEQEITELQRRNTELEELEHTEDHLHLLQRFASLSSPPSTREWSEIGIHSELCVGTVRRAFSKLDDTLKNELDSLKKRELKKMQEYAVDVVLDPDTAHPNIVLSADGKQAGRGDLMHVLPDNPQRFDPVICVLAKRGFLSGRFYFQVAVGTKTFWDLGVVKESVNRKGMITSTPDYGYWTVRLRGGDEYRALESPSVLLRLQQKPQTVGVFVDYEEGTVAFFDVEARSHIYSFTGCSFTERLLPFLSPSVSDDGRNTAPLVITAVNHEA